MAKEENNENIEKQAKVCQLTGRVSQSVKEEFERLREDGGYETFSLFMEALLERYQNPLKVNKANAAKIADLEKTIEALKAKIQEKEADNAAACETVNEARAEFEALKAEHNAALAKIEQLQRDNADQRHTIDEYDTLKTSISGCISVPVDELDMKCLKYLAEREARLRKRDDITPAVFFMYAVREMLIKGNKFSIDSVPDNVIAKFKKEIEDGK